MTPWTKLSKEERLTILTNIAEDKGIVENAIEKDFWVSMVLKALHTLPYAEHIAFKGGTSLSKCWNLIARFSEDVDIALSREFLGFSGELSKTQISDRLRRAACSFVREKMQHDVRKALVDLGIRADAVEAQTVNEPEAADNEAMQAYCKQLQEKSAAEAQAQQALVSSFI